MPNTKSVGARKQEQISSVTRIQLKFAVFHWFGLANSAYNCIRSNNGITSVYMRVRALTISRWVNEYTIQNVAQYFLSVI